MVAHHNPALGAFGVSFSWGVVRLSRAEALGVRSTGPSCGYRNRLEQ